jgi:hypothetical protein
MRAKAAGQRQLPATGAVPKRVRAHASTGVEEHGKYTRRSPWNLGDPFVSAEAVSASERNERLEMGEGES